MKEIEMLLKPRYEVIADYPNSVLKVGSIVEIKGDAPFDVIQYYGCSRYPHLFRKLQWWEKRKPEEMPEYLKDEHGEIWRVREYTKSNVVFLFKNFVDRDFPYGDHDLYYLLPATESEYTLYINNQK